LQQPGGQASSAHAVNQQHDHIIDFSRQKTVGKNSAHPTLAYAFHITKRVAKILSILQKPQTQLLAGNLGQICLKMPAIASVLFLEAIGRKRFTSPSG
jgi:hypothetical protein